MVNQNFSCSGGLHIVYYLRIYYYGFIFGNFGENLTVIVTLPAVRIPMTVISKVLLFTLVRIIFLFKKEPNIQKWEKNHYYCMYCLL